MINVYGFTGRELEPETGLVYYRARYYDGERFISEDPIGFGGGDGNLYRYVGNSPTNFTDPSGNIAVGAIIVGGIVIPIIADLIFPDGVQAPTSPCDNQPNLDKSLERGLLELGLGFGTDLLSSPQFWRGLGGLGDDLFKGLDNMFGPPPGLDFAPIGPNLGDDLLRGGSKFGGPLSGPGTQAGAGGALGGGLGDLNRPLEASSGSGGNSNNSEISPRTPVGRSGQRNHFPNPNAPQPRNAPTNINGRDFSGHGIDRMQERGFTLSVVENAIQHGTPSPGNSPNTTVFTDPVNNIRVIVNSETGRVITVIGGSK